MRRPIGELLVAERPSLLAYLRRVGDPADAEDAFQEVALRALRQASSLSLVRDPRAWLFGIARHVAYSPPPRIPSRAEIPTPKDPYREAERTLLAGTLADCLRVLPEDARALLLDHHLQGIPLAELGARERLGEPVLAARLARARRRVVAHLSPEARRSLLAFGVPVPARAPTPIWCPLCADTRLEVEDDGGESILRLICPRCPEACFDAEGRVARFFQGTPRIALTRLLNFTHAVVRQWQAPTPLPCPHCTAKGAHQAALSEERLTSHCRSCGLQTAHNLWEVALAYPQVRQFWRTHDRIEAIREDQRLTFVSRKSAETLSLPLCQKSCLPIP